MSNIRERVYTGKQIVDVLSETTEYAGSTTSGVGRSSTAKLRSFIIEATSNSTLSPFVYKDLLRALIVAFGNMSYVDGQGQRQRIKAMHGNPERTIAKLFQENNIVLPVLTVMQDNARDDMTKRRYDNILIQKSVWDDKIQRAERIISVADVPVRLTYNLNLWAKYMEDLDQISQSIRVRFNPGIQLHTPISNSIKTFLLTEANKSSIATGDREDRILRKSYILEVEAFIPSPKFKITSTGRIEKVVSELWLS